MQFDNEGWTTMTNQTQVEVLRDKTTLSLNSQCLPCLGGNLILNNTTDTTNVEAQAVRTVTSD